MFNPLYSSIPAQSARRLLLTAVFAGLIVNSFSNLASAKTTKLLTSADADQDWKESPNGGDLPAFNFKDKSSSVTSAVTTPEDADQYFPNSAIKYEYSNKIKEVKKLEEQEKQAALEREEYEKKKVEAMDKIDRYKHEVLELQQKENKLADEADLMKAEVAKVQGLQDRVQAQLKEVSDKVQIENSKNEEITARLHATEENLRHANADLQKSRVQSEARLSKIKIEMQQGLADISRDEAVIARTESEKTDIQIKETQIRGDLVFVENKKKGLEEERLRLGLELANMERNYRSVQREYAKTKAESDASDKEVKALASKVSKAKDSMISETNKLESRIVQSKDMVVRNQYEKERLNAEMEKINEQVAVARKRYDETVAELDESNIAVIQSKTSVETSKSQLNMQLTETDKLKSKEKTKRNQIRNLASLAESSDMLDAQTKAKVLKACKVTREPSSTSPTSGRLAEGTVIYAAPTDNGFYKLLNKSGRPQYVDQACLQVIED